MVRNDNQMKYLYRAHSRDIFGKNKQFMLIEK